MKILIAVDMEGISGVVNWDQVTPGHSEYARFRRIMTEDVNAAIRGAFEAGAQEILVTDGHSAGYNLMIEHLDARARLNAGNGSPFSMVAGIDQEVDGAFFVGYHACSGSRHAVLDHTWSSATIANLWLNGKLVGETGLNAAVCGHFEVPVLLVTGDQTVCGEAKALLGNIEFAVVKQATGRLSANCLPPALAQDKICEAAARAIQRLNTKSAPQPYVVNSPVEVRVEFHNSHLADQAERIPGSHRVDGRTLELVAQDMPSAYQGFQALVSMAKC